MTQSGCDKEMNNDAIEQIRKVFNELNRPSKNRLATALKARGIPYDTKTLNEVVGESPQKQLDAPAYQYKGKIASPDVNARWAIDTIDLTQYPSKTKGDDKNPMRYIVVAQDIFTRKVFAEASSSVSPAAVSAIFELSLIHISEPTRPY